MKKILFFLTIIVLLLCNSSNTIAQDEGGKVILDLKSDRYIEYDNSRFWPKFIQKGVDYFQDVKQYNEQLSGEYVERDFSDDLHNKYPEYSQESIEIWQKMVRKGIKAVRFWDDIKQKVKQWVLDYELPIVVEDNQYATKAKEKYIPTDKPLIITDFKKVITYSDRKKDRLAREEKYAIDHNLVRPSQMIKWYRQNISQGNWKKLLSSLWSKVDFTGKSTEKKETRKNIAAFLALKYDGIDTDGNFEGIIDITPPEGKVVLMSDYRDYSGLAIMTDESENIKDIQFNYTLPQHIVDKSDTAVLLYGKKFTIYFKGKLRDVAEEALLKINIDANLCVENSCTPEKTALSITLTPSAAPKLSKYADYINSIKRQLPSADYQKYFKIYGLFEENRESQDGMRLEFAVDNNAFADVLFIGPYAQYFAAPKLSLINNRVNAWFQLKDRQFDYKNKTYKFWLIDRKGGQFITDLSLTSESLFNVHKTTFSFKIFCLAILGGLLLNFMPCVFPVLSVKILAFTKFGGLNKQKIRTDFLYNTYGIFAAFAILAILLSLLKAGGIALGWGMQFQSLIFLATMTWIVTYFLAYVFGIVGYSMADPAQKTLNKAYKNEKLFEFLSGLFLVALSTPCMAPYLGTALGIALAGSPLDIIFAVMATGLGLALPYIAIAAFPAIAVYMPRPGKWLKLINILMITMLIITLLWLISLISTQTTNWTFWRWIAYIILALIIWAIYKVLFSEIEKVNDKKIRETLRRTYHYWEMAFSILLIALSFIDIKWNDWKRKSAATFSPIMTINQQTIDYYVARGQKVLVKIGANWCLTCKYNDAVIFDVDYIKEEMMTNNVLVMEADWSNYNEQLLHYMQKFGHQGLPFYILFSPTFSEGIVLPEIPDISEFEKLISM